MRANESSLRREIVRIGQLMYQKGFISASDGNISARLTPDLFLTTPSGLHKGLLEPDQLLIVDAEGRQAGPSRTYGARLKPTSELPMHLEAFRQRPDVHAVVHAHPPVTIALSIAGIPLADCLLPEVIVFLGLIPTSEYATPSSDENVRAIRALIANHDAIVLQRHGSLTVGDSLMQAFMRLETVEQNARVAFMLAQLGVRHTLPPEEVEKLLEQRRQMGLSKPGEAADFCAVCGVCHTGNQHAPTMRPNCKNPMSSQPSSLHTGPQALPPIGISLSSGPFPGPQESGSPDKQLSSVDDDSIRELVARIVEKTLGGT